MDIDKIDNPAANAYRAAVIAFEDEQNRLTDLQAMQRRMTRTEDPDAFLLRATPRPLPATEPKPLIFAVVLLAALIGVVSGIGLERAWTAHNAVEVAK